MSELKDEHYLRAVTQMGDTRKIVSNQDIYSKNGIMLVASGVAITSKLYERLVNHVLLKPLEMSLSADEVVDPEVILGDVQDLIRKNDKLKKMVDILDKGFHLSQTISSIQIPATLAFKLTVAREKYPHIYQRSLSILVMGVYLARCDGMNLNEERNVATAALFHDIGLLHINPSLLDPAHVMSSEERRHLYAHPLMAYLLLREFPELPGCISDAVLEHHERMDGRGYPRGLRGGKISRLGQILAVAEVSAKALDPDSPSGQWEKLEVMLKLNSKQYGGRLIGFLSVLRGGDETDGNPSVNNPGELSSQVGLVAKLYVDFDQYADIGRGNGIYDFAQTRLTELRLGLLEAGFDPHDPEEIIQRFADDPECMSDYETLLKETLWQFKALILDISRLWPEEANSKKTEYAWLDAMEQLLIVV